MSSLPRAALLLSTVELCYLRLWDCTSPIKPVLQLHLPQHSQGLVGEA